MKTDLPRYMRAKRLAAGRMAYYWQPPNWARRGAVRAGRKCPVGATPLGSQLAAAIEKAEALNAALDGWRQGESRPIEEVGTISWLFRWYRTHRLFTEKAAKTRKDYVRHMDLVENLPMRSGVLGTRLASAVDGTAADKIYERLLPRGERTAGYAIQVCRLVWNQAVRHKRATQVSDNPFLKMRLKSRPKRVNRATSRAEYDLYRVTAHTLGHGEFAAAAALSFELCQRVSTVFDYPTEDRKERGIYWRDYSAGRQIHLRQSKTGTYLDIPLAVHEPDGSATLLYPELEAELAQLERNGGNIIINPRTGQPYTERAVSSIHRKICDAAGLPKTMTFTGFRHGGITEIGNAGEVDVRALSGHKQLSTTMIYNQVNREKAIRIAEVRRRHIEMLGETEVED